jgi:glucose/arabinose dehydrogenase
MTGTEAVFVEDWCQQYPSHSIGSMAFGNDGELYVSGGDGASFNFVDYGQDGTPLNPCGDPPSGVGGVQTPPTAEGGALRSQDLRTSGDPVALNGSILRLDPTTGLALPDNPLFSNSDPNARRIIAHGLRNPFRITARPGTSEIWVGDVGWTNWEEINRIEIPTGPIVENFGWPCYEGINKQAGYDNANLNICENLYGVSNGVVAPYFAYLHSQKVVPDESCPTGSSSIAGLNFYTSGSFPSNYNGALFFADYSRDCVWAMFEGVDGQPDSTNIVTFAAAATNPVDIQVSPSGELFYADFDGGTIRRIAYVSTNQPPLAVASANPTSGNAPLEVDFDASDSSDPDTGQTLTYAWDLDGDGQFDDASTIVASFTYATPGTVTAALKVTDSDGLFDLDTITINVSGNNAPTATISTPSSSTLWQVGQVISFSGSAMDQEDGTMPASALTWTLLMHHCPSTCHVHTLQQFVGVANGTFTAPDHEYPSHLELKLTATDSGGLQNTKSVLLNPQTVELRFRSRPTSAVFNLGLNGTTAPAPFNRRVIVGSQNTISAPTPQIVNGIRYAFSSWSDGGAQTHTITAPALAFQTYTATFVVSSSNPTPTISTPSASTLWQVNQVISFSGSSTDPEDGTLPASALTWTLLWHHCPSTCTVQTLQQFIGVASGTFTTPNVPYPSHLELRLTATDSNGEQGTTSVLLNPQTVELRFRSNPASVAFNLVFNGSSTNTPFNRRVIVGSQNTINAPSPQTINSVTYAFSSWSDGGAQSHTIIGPALAFQTYTVRYVISTGNPTATISTPTAGTLWQVNQVIFFSGSATDPEDGTLPASALKWTLLWHHCPSTCTVQTLQQFVGVANGSFTTPDVPYPSHLELQLTATDSTGLQNTKSLQLNPQTVELRFRSRPTTAAFDLTVNGTTITTPFNRLAIVGSTNTIGAVSPQIKNGITYVFSFWSDGGAQNHTIIAPNLTFQTYTAWFVAQ